MKDEKMKGDDEFDLDHTEDIQATVSEGKAAIASMPGRHMPI